MSFFGFSDPINVRTSSPVGCRGPRFEHDTAGGRTPDLAADSQSSRPLGHGAVIVLIESENALSKNDLFVIAISLFSSGAKFLGGRYSAVGGATFDCNHRRMGGALLFPGRSEWQEHSQSAQSLHASLRHQSILLVSLRFSARNSNTEEPYMV